MKKYLLFATVFVSSLLAYNAIAQEGEAQKEKVVKGFLHTILYMKDGTTAEGYLQNSTPGVYFHYRIPDALDSVMVLRPDNKLFTRSRKFDNCNIDSMKTWMDDSPKVKIKWEAEHVDFAFGGKTSTEDSYPSMLPILFQGKHVKGYFSFHFIYGFKFLFKMDDMPYAKAYLKEKDKLNERRRKTLLDTFYMYPEMEAYINTLTTKDIKEDPFCILKKLDEVLCVRHKTKQNK